MPWDERHHISPSKDNGRNHHYYREYFDKPYGKRAIKVVSPKKSPILDPPNLRASLDKSLNRIPDYSSARPIGTRHYEYGWNNRANVTYSKDNNFIYATQREYFDTPQGEESPSTSRMENGSTFSSTFQRRSSGLRTLSMSFQGERNSSLELRESYDPTGRKKLKEKTWNPAYLPMSEFNVVKHKDLRTYFEAMVKRPRMSF